ncbi:MAG: S-layer homology domain-containing protein [Defluviitaleaceae bacterium]|nr:S-layer homology domain-containing protein [Defluviitaleaceae bacterium]
MKSTQNKVFAVAVAIVLMAGSIGVTAFASAVQPRQLPFTDVSEDAWYYPHVAMVWESQLIRGTSATTFEPMGNVTRAMFVQILANLERVDLAAYTDATQRFYDVLPGSWYFAAVSFAEAQGFIYGAGGGNFEPDRPITRHEMTLLLNRYIAIRGLGLPRFETDNHDAATRADAATVFVSLLRAAVTTSEEVEHTEEIAAEQAEEKVGEVQITIPAENVEVRVEIAPADALAAVVARLYNNGNPHDVNIPANQFSPNVSTGLELPEGIVLMNYVETLSFHGEFLLTVLSAGIPRFVTAGMALNFSPFNVVQPQMLFVNVITRGEPVPAGLYIFPNVILRHTESGTNSAPFTLRINVIVN